MIGTISYDEVNKLRETLINCVNKMNTYEIVNNNSRLKEFLRLIESYDKYLETTIEINKEVDIALEELKSLNNKGWFIILLFIKLLIFVIITMRVKWEEEIEGKKLILYFY